jgi:hypothetical protein
MDVKHYEGLAINANKTILHYYFHYNSHPVKSELTEKAYAIRPKIAIISHIEISQLWMSY